MNIIKRMYLYIVTLKSIFIIGIFLILNFYTVSIFANFDSPHIDNYVINGIKNGHLGINMKKPNNNINISNNIIDKIIYDSRVKGSYMNIGDPLIANSNNNSNTKDIKTSGGEYIKKIKINIPKIGINQETFLMKIGDLDKATDQKSDKDTIDIELNDFYNIDNGFFVGGHSSGYWWDKSDKKEIFKDLNNLEVGDLIYMEVETINKKITKTYTVINKEIGINIKTRKEDKIVYTCYPFNTSAERLVLKLEQLK